MILIPHRPTLFILTFLIRLLLITRFFKQLSTEKVRVINSISTTKFCTLFTLSTGSISAEHGIGQQKQKLMPLIRSENELRLMKNIKFVLDPNGILNPGKLLN